MKFIKCGGNEKKKMDVTHKEKEILTAPEAKWDFKCSDML